jgi:NADPH:quinone reductase-like Zn-dependent oxidoreductase
MRAALIEAFGEPTEVLELVDVPEPTGPAAGEGVGRCRARANQHE